MLNAAKHNKCGVRSFASLRMTSWTFLFVIELSRSFEPCLKAIHENQIKLYRDWIHRKDHGYHALDHKRVGLDHSDDAHNRDAFPTPFALLHQRSCLIARDH